VPKLLSLALVHKVLQNLLRERVSIRDAVTILEALGEAANMTRNPILLTEYTRQALARVIVRPYLSPSGELQAYFFDPALEQSVEASAEHGEHSSSVRLAPQKVRDILEKIQRKTTAADGPVVAIASSGARYFLRQIVEPSMRNLFILSHNEIPPGTRVVSLGLFG
jgi:flagellar biosynthesis protein FlhA